jgi:RNA polymerase sigma-32 factor
VVPRSQHGLILDLFSEKDMKAEEVVGDEEHLAVDKQRIAAALSKLDVRDQRVIRARYLRKKPLTLKQVGDKLGISRERVRQLEERALKKLKEVIK